MVIVVKWVRKTGPKSRKNGPRVWAFCKIEFPGIQKPVQIFDQKSSFFGKCGNRGVGVIWWGRRGVLGFILFGGGVFGFGSLVVVGFRFDVALAWRLRFYRYLDQHSYTYPYYTH